MGTTHGQSPLEQTEYPVLLIHQERGSYYLQEGGLKIVISINQDAAINVTAQSILFAGINSL